MRLYISSKSTFYFLFFVSLFASCSKKLNTSSSQEENFNNRKVEHIDSTKIRYFLKDPRDFSKLNFKNNCSRIKDQDSSSLIWPKKEYYICEYYRKNKKGAEIKYSIYKTDSTWQMGTNGFMTYSFITDEPKFPLKNDLNVGRSIKDFIKFFGSPKQFENSYLFNFKFDVFSSKLNLETNDKIVTKITIENSMNY